MDFIENIDVFLTSFGNSGQSSFSRHFPRLAIKRLTIKIASEYVTIYIEQELEIDRQ